MLSTALAGCATRPPKPPAPTVHAVKVGGPTPSADLLVCPGPVDGFPLDEIATLPPRVRDAAIRVVKSLAERTAHLKQLIEFHEPGTCR
jgi:hypothetical protein